MPPFYMQDVNIPILHANDAWLLAENGLQQMLDRLYVGRRSMDLKFNVPKSWLLFLTRKIE